MTRHLRPAGLAVCGLLLLSSCATGRLPARGVGLPPDAVQAFEIAGAGSAWAHDPSSTPRMPLWQRAMDDPLDATARVDGLVDLLAATAADPEAVLRAMGAERAATMENGAPDVSGLPSSLREPVGRLLAAIATAELARLSALAGLPAALTAERLGEQVRNGPSQPLDYRSWVGTARIDALLSASAGLVGAVARFRKEVANLAPLPPVAWRRETPLGLILVDTTGADNRHRLADPLLVIDVGGNDTYEFVSRGERNRISVLLDVGGDDTYIVEQDGADPSAAILGIGILWDTSGNDSYRGGHIAQASAAFGVALLVDEAGENRFEAIGHAQAHAIVGVAVMITGEGADRYTAQTAAQGSAGPGGVALLMDRGGDDHYQLSATPLVRPSAQLPDRNASLGQGVGYGIRVGREHGGPAAGGLGMLLDLAGNDRYEAQVFAQGAGYQQGVGVLVDFAGRDQLDAAWYAMGASAHGGVGVLLKRGNGDDRYLVSHTMGIGAAHDLSVAVFRDEGGNDSYRVPDLGLGAAHDNSFAIFIDAAGSDAYAVSDTVSGTAGRPCRVMGEAAWSERGSAMDRMANIAVFADLAGEDRWPVACGGKRVQARWRIAK